MRGWKSVANYFGRDERTVMRWAKERGLPVRRLPGEGRSSVYALPEELAAWLAGVGSGEATAEPEREPAAADDPPTPTVAHEARLPQRSAIRRSPTLVVAGLLAAIVVAIVLVLVRTSGGEAPSIVPSGHSSPDPASQRAFVQASYDLENRTPDSLRRAVSGFGAAIAADPRNAQAYAGLGTAYLLLPEYSPTPAPMAYARARAAADAAIALDPGSAPAHRVRAFVAFWADRDLPLAKREFQTALRIDPEDPVTHHWYATALSANGQEDQAVAEIDRALVLDPQSTSIMADSGLLLALAGDRKAGLERLHMVERTRPDQISAHSYLAELAFEVADDRTFLAEKAMTARLRGDADTAELVAAAQKGFASGGHAGLLQALDRTLTAQVRERGSGYYALARIAAVEGQDSRARALLAQAERHGDPGMPAMAGDLVFRRLRAAPTSPGSL